MNPKYQKVLSDIEKAEKKKSEIEGQLKELYDKKTELENLEIINTVRSMVMDKDQIMAFRLRSYLACRILCQHGYECYNFSGGYRLYRAILENAFNEKANTPCGFSIGDAGEK